MQLPRFLLLSSLLCTAAAHADLTIVQKVEGSEGTNKITLKIKGDKARVEISPQITTIMDAKTGDLTNLLNDDKKVIRIAGEKAKAMAEMAKALTKENDAATAAPKPTGKKETINGYETEEYLTDTPKYQASYWVAKNFPNYQAVLQQMAVLQNGAFAAMRKGLPDYANLPGLPIRTQIKIDGKNQMTSTIESVNTNPLADSEFAVPAGYSEMKVPDFIGGKKTPDRPGQE